MKKAPYYFLKTLKTTLFFALFFSFSLINAESIVVKGGSTGVDLQVLNTDKSSTKVEFNFYSFDTEKIFINGKEYVTLSAPNAHQLLEKGAPDLPIFRKSIIVSDDKAISYRIIQSEYVTKSVGTLAPSKGNFTRDIDPETVAYTFSDVYKTKTNFPVNNFSLSSPYVIRDFRGVTMQFNPIQYNPSDKTIKICTRLVVEIFSNNNEDAENPLVRTKPFEGISKEYEMVYSRLFANYGNNGIEYNYIPEPGRLLIIYNSAYENAILPFYNWKVSKGIPTLKASYPSETGSGANAIKTYIQNLYNSTEGLTYIILVGEATEIPYLSGVYEGAPSDPCYVKLAGTDAYPDAFISRISPKSVTNLSYVLNKIIRYEDQPFTGADGAWYLKGVGVASDEGTPADWQRCNLLRDMLLNDMHFTSVDQIYDPGASSSTVTTKLNEGRSIINYIGHGSGTSWSTTDFSTTEINALSNGYKNPFVFDVACQNGDFRVSECFEEAWLRAGDTLNPKGAIAAFGASTNASWVPPCDMQSSAMELLTSRDKMTVGGVCIGGLVEAMDINGGSTGEGLKMMEQYHIFGDPMTKLTFGLVQDSTPPTTIADITTTEPLSGALTITWSAPLDSSIGGIISYDLRYSSTQIVNDNDFANATSIIIPANGDTLGMQKSYTLDNLGFNSTFYFAIKSVDIWGNVSALSNVAIGTTLGAPTFSCATDSIVYSTVQTVTIQDSLIVANTSANPSTLDFSVELTNSTFPEKSVSVNLSQVPSTYSTEMENKSNPIITRGMSVKGSGGPDSFGYEWIDSDASNGPVYEWNDISTTGTLASNWIATGSYQASDEGYVSLDMGINFKFYGNVYSQLYVSSNGYVSFEQPEGATYTNTVLPNSSEPNNLIAAFWDDLDGKTAGKVYYKTDGNKFIVQYHNWSPYGSSATGVLNFQIVLYSSGKIIIYYGNCTADLTDCTIGIENASGNVGLQVVKDANYVKPNLAVKFSAEPDWLQFNYTSALLYNGNSAKVGLTIKTEDLESGDYSMDVLIKTNDPNHLTHTVPVKLHFGSEVPVELTSFEAVANGNNIQLTWSTATETNNNGFEIQRKTESDDWSTVSFIKGNGTTTERHNYFYNDLPANLKGSFVSYRLKQVDYDGSFSYSKVIEAELVPNQFSLDQNYPNPFNPTTTIKFSVPEKANVSIKIFNSLGQIVNEVLNNNFDAGYYSINFNASNLASGVYYYRMDAGNFTQIKKMMLVK